MVVSPSEQMQAYNSAYDLGYRTALNDIENKKTPSTKVRDFFQLLGFGPRKDP